MATAKKLLKIVITGPFDAGKSQFIETISEIEVVSTERKITTEDRQIKSETTVAMDFGRITLSDCVMQLFGTPGQPRFEFMWEILAKEMDGFVILVDSTQPERLDEAQRLLELFRHLAPVPFIVAANKQDIAGAMRPNQIHRALNLSSGTPVLPSVSIEHDSVYSILVQLEHAIRFRG